MSASTDSGHTRRRVCQIYRYVVIVFTNMLDATTLAFVPDTTRLCGLWWWWATSASASLLAPGVHRRNVYDSVARLQHRGLLSVHALTKQKIYRYLPTLQELLRNDERSAIAKKKSSGGREVALACLVPADTVPVQAFVGKEIGNVFSDILKEGKLALVLSAACRANIAPFAAPLSCTASSA